jgi:lauroyl/myristoyl acyltransferase
MSVADAMERWQRVASEVDSMLTQHPPLQLPASRESTALALAAANLARLIPEQLPRVDALLRDMLISQRVAWREPHDWRWLESCPVDDASGWLDSGAESALYLCSHYGAYRQLFSVLAARGRNTVLLVAGSAARQQGPALLELLATARQQARWPGQLEILDAALPSSLLSLRRRVREGWSLAVFIDGLPEARLQEGVQATPPLSVTLLGHALTVRNGAAQLAHRLKLPVIPVLGVRRQRLQAAVQLATPLRPVAHEGATEFARRCTQAALDGLGQALKDDPGPWEAWIYLHRLMPPLATRCSAEAKLEPSLPRADPARFATLRMDGHDLLLHKPDQRCLALQTDDIAWLRAWLCNAASDLTPSSRLQHWLQQLQ